jgi:hypothetical protein
MLPTERLLTFRNHFRESMFWQILRNRLPKPIRKDTLKPLHAQAVGTTYGTSLKLNICIPSI